MRKRGDRLATQSGCERRRLKPIPLVITHTQPFGRRLAFCSMSNDEGRSISTSAESPLATTARWRREIMRRHELVTGKKIWAGASITKRQDGRVVRINTQARRGK